MKTLLPKTLFTAKRSVFTTKALYAGLTMLFLMVFAPVAAQSTSIYESYAIINANGGGNVFYDLNAATANPDFQGTNLGTFTAAQTLVLAGGQNKTSKCSGGNVTGSNIYYRVYLVSGTAGTFSSAIAYSFTSNDASTNGCGAGNQTWTNSTNATNVKAGLSPGVYYLEVYADAPGTPSTAFANNGGANYKATFTVSSALSLYDFTAGTAAATTNKTGGTLSSMTSNNNVGTTVTGGVVTNASVSNNSGASGTFNIGNVTPGGALNTGTSGYFEFVITPPAGGSVVFNSLTFGSRSTTSGATNYAIRTSADSYAANVATGTLHGTTWTLVSPTASTVTGAPGAALTIRIYGYGGTGAAANTIVWRIDDINIVSGLSFSPALSVSSNTLTFSTTQVVGTPTASQTFNLSGSNLSGAPANITVTAPNTDFEVSNNNSTWGSSTTIAYSTATLTATPVYVRFNPQSAGAKTGNVTFSGTGITSPPTVAVTGTGVAAPAITSIAVAAPGSGSSGYVGNTITITGSGLTGVTVLKVGGSGGTTVSTFTVVSDTSITFLAIAASGTIYVQNTIGNATSATSYTNLGYITTATGTWQTAGTWLGGAVPPSATSTPITIAHNVTGTTGTILVGSLTVNTGVTLTTTAASTLTVNTASTNSGTITSNGTFGVTGVTYTNSGAFNIGNGGTFQLNSGAFYTGTAIAYNATASTLAFNAAFQYGVASGHTYWPTTAGPVTVSLINAAGGVQLLTGTARTVTNVLLAANLDIVDANALTVNGTLTVNNGGSISSNPPVYGSSSTLLYNSVTGYGVNNEWTGNATTAGAGTPQNVTLTTSTLNMPGTARSIAGNLSIGAGSTLTLSGTFGAALNLSGNWTNSGTFASSSRAVQFRGTAAQTITGATTFTYLTINNSSTGVTLANAVTVGNELNLTLGKLTLGTLSLTMSPGATIINASATSYVATSSTGQLLRTVAGAVAFPVGVSAYNPITLNNSGTSDVLGVRVVDGALTTAFDNLKTVSRRWLVSEGTAGGSILTVAGQYNTGEENTSYVAGTNAFVGFYNGSSWTQAAATLSGSNPFTSTAGATISPTTLTGTQYFALGKDNAFLSIASKLVVTAIAPTSPTAGIGFSATVRSQDAYGAFSNVVAGTAFTLTTNGSAGTIGGTTTGTITAGTSTVTVSGITLSTAGTGATLTATRTSGDVLTAGTSSAFNVLSPASQLAFVSVPGTGSTGTALTAFTVEARRPDNSLDDTYTGSITIAKASGPGTLSGTLTVAAVAGVATFSAAQFDTPGTVTLSATAPTSLTGGPSSSIVIALAPVALGTYTFTGTACSAGALTASSVVSNLTLSLASVTGQTCNNNSAVSYSVGGSSWGTAFNSGKYYEFTATPAAGYTLSSSTLTFDILRSGAGATNATVRSSADGYTADLITAFTVGTGSSSKSVTLGGAPFTTQTTPITFRIYGWGGNSTGDLRIDNLTLNGNVLCLDPTLYTVTGGGTYCPSGTGVAVGLSNSQSALNYQLKINGTNSGSPVAGTGAAISFGLQTTVGTYTVVATNTNGTCSLSTTMTGSVAVATYSPATASVISGVATVCPGTAANIQVAITGGTSPYSVVYTDGTSNFTASSYTSGSNISVSPSTTTTYTIVSVTDANGCAGSGNSGSAVITVYSPATASVISGTASTCSGAATNLQVTITGGTSPYTVVYTDGTSNFTVSSYTSAANISVSPSTTTTYTLVSVTDANGCAGTGNSGSAVVTSGATSTWNGTSWSPSTPTSASAVVFAGDYTAASNLTFCSVSVTSGNVIIPSGYNITLNGAINVSGGSFVLQNNANLVQNTSASNSGNIVVNRNSASILRQDYTLWSSPVTNSGLYLQAFSPMTLATRFYTYDPSSNIYVAVSSPSTTPFTAATSYLIRVANNHNAVTPTVWAGQFTGIPNNGPISLSVTSGTYNATGNPYPSTISADSFISANSITEALYFWRKTNNTAQATSPTTSYATYTTAGGAGTGPSGLGGITPNGTIQVGQGFIAKATSSALNFTNAMRTTNNSDQFLRTGERSRVWVDLYNAAGSVSQALVAYMPGATLGIDAAIDGHYINDAPTALTSMINDEEFAVQGRPLPFEATDVVPLGFKSQNAGSFTIALNHVDGLFASNNQTVYLKDNLTNTIQDLTAGNYDFATEAGTFNSRFEIVYENLLATQNPTFTENSVVVYKNDQQVVVNAGKTTIAKVQVYDISGRLLVTKTNVNATEVRFTAGMANQVLLVKVTSASGAVVTKKIVN